jgi:hypothetical protein
LAENQPGSTDTATAMAIMAEEETMRFCVEKIAIWSHEAGEKIPRSSSVRLAGFGMQKIDDSGLVFQSGRS